jgi:hypothetical protein
MNTMVFVLIGAAVVVLLAFVAVWLIDARRAEQVEHDPERTEPETGRPRRRARH